MKYQSELIKEIVEARGHKQSSLHYESECIETWIEEAKGAYPKLCDYQSEWLNYISILDDTGGEYPEPPIGEFPYETITDVTEATVDNVVPLAYKSAVLKGNTIDTILDFTESFRIQNAVKDINFVFSPKLNKKYMLSLELTNVSPRNGESDYIAVRGVKEDGSYDELTKVKQSYANGIYEIPCEFTKNYSKLRMAISFNATIVNMKLRGDLISVRMPVLTTSNEDGTKTNILRVNEDVTLCGIGDVHDTLDCLTGEVMERIGEMVLNGSENWRGPFSGGATVEGMYYYTYDDTRIKRNTTTNVLTTISYGGFASVPFTSVWKLQQEGISSSNSTGLGLRLATKIASVTELKSYLQQNPTTVKYQLATESIIKTVELNIQDQNGKTLSVIKPIEGTMHLSTSSDTIKPLFSGEIPVEAITQNLASFIDFEMEE